MNKTVSIIALCGIVSHSLARLTYPILLPAIEADVLANHKQSGVLSTVGFAGYLGGVAVATSISGRVEPLGLLRTGLGLAAVGFATLGFAPGFKTLIVGQALAGLGSAGIWMSAPVLATALVAPHRRGTVMGAFSSLMGLGIFAVAMSINAMRSVVDNEGAWRPVWLAACGFAVALLVGVMLSIRAAPTAKISGGIGLGRLKAVPRWKSLAAGYWLFGLVNSSFSVFLGVALEHQGLSRDYVTTLYSTFGLAAAVAAVGMGRLSDRVGRRLVLSGAALGLSLAAVLVLAGSPVLASIAAPIFGASSFVFPVLVVTHLRDHVADRAFANALGALTLFYSSALMAGPAIAGVVADTPLGFNTVFGFAAVGSVGIAYFILRLPANHEPI